MNKIIRRDTGERVDIELTDIQNSELGDYTIIFRPAFFRHPFSFMMNIAFFALAWYMRESMEIENDMEYYAALYMPYLASLFLFINTIQNLYNKYSTLFIVDAHQIIEKNGILTTNTVRLAPSEISTNHVKSSIPQKILGIGSIDICGDNLAGDAFTVSGVWEAGKISDYIQRVTFKASSGK